MKVVERISRAWCAKLSVGTLPLDLLGERTEEEELFLFSLYTILKVDIVIMGKKKKT